VRSRYLFKMHMYIRSHDDFIAGRDIGSCQRPVIKVLIAVKRYDGATKGHPWS
jgi:hypothetical protein